MLTVEPLRHDEANDLQRKKEARNYVFNEFTSQFRALGQSVTPMLRTGFRTVSAPLLMVWGKPIHGV